MFIDIPVYDAGTSSVENQVLQTDHFARMQTNADVPVDPGAVPTAASQITFSDGTLVIVTVSFETLKLRLTALTGEISDIGEVV